MTTNIEWKDHFGFASGIVVAWGLLLTKLLPVASAMQLPNGLALVDDQGRAEYNYYAFLLIVLFSAFGITTLILGVLHICARGLWLTSDLNKSWLTDRTRLDGICRVTFASVFFATRYALASLCIIPLLFLSVALQRGIHYLFSINSARVGLTFATVFGFLSTGIFVITVFGRLLSMETDKDEISPSEVASFLGIFVLFLAVGLTIQGAYTVELTIPKTVYDRTVSGVDVSVRLGGMTSEVKKLRLVLVNGKNETIRTLEIFDLGEGSYAARIDISGFVSGRYGIILEYPHMDIGFVPLRAGWLRREQWFLLAN